MSFFGCVRFREEASYFIQSLPNTLQELNLNFGGIGFKMSEEFALGLGLLSNLLSLKLSLHRTPNYALTFDFLDDFCSGRLTGPTSSHLAPAPRKPQELICCAALWSELAKLDKLRELELKVRESKGLTCIDGMVEAIFNMPALETPTLSFRGCNLNQVHGIKACSPARAFDQLTCLTISIYENRDLVSIAGITNIIERALALEELSVSLGALSLSANEGASFCAALQKSRQLQRLYIAMEGKSVDGLGEAIEGMAKLARLTLHFERCMLPTDEIFSMFRALKNQEELRELHLTMKGNKHLTSISELVSSLGNMPKLADSKFDFIGCPISYESVISLYNQKSRRHWTEIKIGSPESSTILTEKAIMSGSLKTALDSVK